MLRNDSLYLSHVFKLNYSISMKSLRGTGGSYDLAMRLSKLWPIASTFMRLGTSDAERGGARGAAAPPALFQGGQRGQYMPYLILQILLDNQSEQSTNRLGMKFSMDREVPSHYFNKIQVYFDFLQFYRMYFVFKCPSKNVCPPPPCALQCFRHPC